MVPLMWRLSTTAAREGVTKERLEQLVKDHGDQAEDVRRALD